MAIPTEMMRQFSEMITQHVAAIAAQYEAHMKATNENHTQQIQMMLNQIQNLGGARPGLETNYNREKLDSKVFTKVDKFDGEWKDWRFTFKSAVRSSSHDVFDLLNWAEKEETEIIDVDAQAPKNIRDASDLVSALYNQIAMLMKGESMQNMHNSNFSGTAPPHEALLSHDSSTRIAAYDVRSEPTEDHEGQQGPRNDRKMRDENTCSSTGFQ